VGRILQVISDGREELKRETEAKGNKGRAERFPIGLQTEGELTRKIEVRKKKPVTPQHVA